MKASTGPKAEGRIDIQKYNPEEIVIVGLDTEDGPSHPLCDQESNSSPVLEADVLFAMDQGVLQAVECKRDGDRLLVVFGRGRTRQLREANKRLTAAGQPPHLLPVAVIRGDDDRLLIRKIGENAHRRALNPMARARDALTLSERMPIERAAATMGVGVSQFKNILALNDLAPSVAKAVSSGKLSATAATSIAALPAAEQEEKLTELLESGEKPTVERTGKAVRESQGKEEKLTPKGRLMLIEQAVDKLEDDATIDDLWKAIKKIRKAIAK